MGYSLEKAVEFTAEEFYETQSPETERRELIDGQIYMMSSPNYRHHCLRK